MALSASQQNKISIPFVKHPFIWIFIAYCIGLITAFYLKKNNDHSYLIFLIPLTILLLIFKRNVKKLGSIILVFIFIFLGYFLFPNPSLPSQKTQKQGIILRLTQVQQSGPNKYKMIAIVQDHKQNNQFEVGGKILTYIQSDPKKNIEENQIILASCIIQPILNKNNPGEFDAEWFWKTKGVNKVAFLQQYDFEILSTSSSFSLNKLISNANNSLISILSSHLEGKQLALAQAILLGDRSLLSQDTVSSFGATGAMHVLAVSGMHIGIISQLLLFILQGFGKVISRRTGLLLVLLFLWFYALTSGFSPSVVRSVFMFSLLLLAQMTGRRYSSINILFFSAFVLILINPMVFFDVGFQLSYLAMLGIFSIYPIIQNWLNFKNKIMHYFWQGTAVCLSAQCVTVPLCIYYFHQFPNYFMIANLGIMILSTLVMGIGLGIFIFHFIPFFGEWWGKLLGLSIEALLNFLDYIAHLPGAVVYGFDISLLFVPLLSLFLFLLVFNKPQKKIWKISAFVTLFLIVQLAFQRFNNQQKNELCFFNNNQFLMSLKINGEIMVFYKFKKNNDTKRIKKLVNDYSKIHTGKIKYVLMNNENLELTMNKKKITILNQYPKKIIQIGALKYCIHFSDTISREKENNNVIHIKMPWIKTQGSLYYGAKIFSLN
jgi:competence protein ComEC